MEWKFYEIPGMPVYENIPDNDLKAEKLLELKEPSSIKEGYVVLAGFMNGVIRMTVKRDKWGSLYLDSDSIISDLDYDPEFGWLATGFINKKALENY